MRLFDLSSVSESPDFAPGGLADDEADNLDDAVGTFDVVAAVALTVVAAGSVALDVLVFDAVCAADSGVCTLAMFTLLTSRVIEAPRPAACNRPSLYG